MWPHVQRNLWRQLKFTKLTIEIKEDTDGKVLTSIDTFDVQYVTSKEYILFRKLLLACDQVLGEVIEHKEVQFDLPPKR